MKYQELVCGVIAIACCAGCEKASETKPASAAINSVHDHDHGDGHEHGHSHGNKAHSHAVGPHDGTVVDWGGGKFHVEFSVDHSKQQATIYILGSDEKTPAPIDAKLIELSIAEPEIQLSLKPLPQEGDPPGKASRFVGAHEKLAVEREFAGTLTGVIEGTPYSGDFKEEAHDAYQH